MRKILSLMMLVAMGSFIFTGCGTKCEDENAINFDEKEDCIYNNAPTISDFAITGDPLAGGTLTITFIASDNEGLKNWKLESEKGGTTTEDFSEDLTGSSQTITHDYTIPNTLAEGDALILTVTITDSNDETATMNQTFTIGAPFAEFSGKFYHRQGTLQGAYDLDKEVLKSAGDAAADKDMENDDAGGSAFTGGWTAANTTMFVKDNTYDYDNATSSSAATAYAAGTASASVAAPAVGDIYIAKLRGTDSYAVVKITSLDPNDAECGCGNTGKMTFDFKK